MWIRSQSGEALINAQSIFTIEDPVNGRYHIMTCLNYRDESLGIYSIEAEAQTVLDQIQGHINKRCKSVFQMPPAGFSQQEKFYPDCGGDLNCCGLLDDSAPPTTCKYLDECKAAWDRGCR